MPSGTSTADAVQDDPAALKQEAAQRYAQGKYAEAELLVRRALEIMEAALGPEHPHVATTLNNLAALLQAQGKYAEAEPLYRRALAIDEAALGPEHPSVAAMLASLAFLLEAQGKYAEAAVHSPGNVVAWLLKLDFPRRPGSRGGVGQFRDVPHSAFQAPEVTPSDTKSPGATVCLCAPQQIAAKTTPRGELDWT